MCRFAVYLGAEIRLSALLSDPANSLIHQSFHSRERVEPLNGDGFGVAWYTKDSDENPALFKSTTPAWNNQNLLEIARVTSTRCLLAHVRAATPGLPVHDLNCHPFTNGHLTFMHNGDVGGFQKLRRRLLAQLSDSAFDTIKGSTDSEHLFAILLDHFQNLDDSGNPVERIAMALNATIRTVETLRRAISPDRPAQLNLVASDGKSAVVTRYASGDEPPNSLYYSTGEMYICDNNLCHMKKSDRAPTAGIIASEPLDDDDNWTRVEPGHMVLMSPDLTVTTVEITLD